MGLAGIRRIPWRRVSRLAHWREDHYRRIVWNWIGRRILVPLGIQRVRPRSRQRVRRISRVINPGAISSSVPPRKGIPLPSRCRIRHRHITERITTLIIRSSRTTIRVIGQRDRIGIPLGIQRVRPRSRQRVRRISRVINPGAISSSVPPRKGIPLPSRCRIRHRHITERITTLIIRSSRTTIRVIGQRDRIGIPLGIQRVRPRSRQRVRRISRVINPGAISSSVPPRKGIPLPSRCRIRHRHITERITTLIIRSSRTTIRVIGQRDRIGIPLGIQRVRPRSRQRVRVVPGITGAGAISSSVPPRKGIPLPSRCRIRHRHITERITTLIIRSSRTTIRAISQRRLADNVLVPLGIQRVRPRSRQRVRRISRVINPGAISSSVPPRKGIPLPSRCRIRHRHITERIATLIIRSSRTTIRAIGQRDRIGIPLGIQRVRPRSRQRVRRISRVINPGAISSSVPPRKGIPLPSRCRIRHRHITERITTLIIRSSRTTIRVIGQRDRIGIPLGIQRVRPRSRQRVRRISRVINPGAISSSVPPRKGIPLRVGVVSDTVTSLNESPL